tara:strand:- start:84 stop:506 length:423 start_codon:yes stop_codon:yes gene_type:complete
MLFWLAIKKMFAKIFAFIKKYWQYFVALVYAFGVWIYFGSKSERTKDLLRIKQDSYDKQIEIINSTYKEEIEKRDAIIEKYKNVLEAIEKDYTEKKKELEANKMEEIKELVEDNIDNPGNLAKLISERYGITYVESGESE